MTEKLKLLLVAGARPNFMKVAPLIKGIKAHNAKNKVGAAAIDYRLVHTGQHYDQKMSDVFFRELGIPTPDINLGVGSGSHAIQTANIMIKFEPVCERENPDWLVVVGDVNSTMACTLVAAKLGVRVTHVEAGLRSFDRSMPEEINRIVTDALADLLLTPSSDADENLRREGIPDGKIRMVGNIMIDALIANLDRARQSDVLLRLALKKKAFVYVTLHRPSNVDDRSTLAAIISELGELAEHIPVVFPMHPRTRKMLSEFGLFGNGNTGLKILDPIGYHESLALTENAKFVLTDSGGLQEESTFLETPCLTLRPNTERPVTITMGSNRLTSVERLSTDIRQTLHRNETPGRIPPLWDGHAAERTLEHLLAATAQ